LRAAAERVIVSQTTAMELMNYRATLERFGHIDAEFVRASASFTAEGGTAEVVVRFYPWLEHPLYVAARDRGDNWGFPSYEPGMREVTVKAVRPFAARLASRQEVIEWSFAESHPLLWGYSEQSTIYVNGPFDPEKLLDGLLAMQLPHVSREDLLTYVYARDRRPVSQGLTVPSQLHKPVLKVLERLEVPIFAPRTPTTPGPATVFLLDDGDYIIADDFEVEVPEFTHDPSWFQPAQEGAG
jgi:hypothetical protein